MKTLVLLAIMRFCGHHAKALTVPTPQQEQIASVIVHEASAFGVDPMLVMVMIARESSFNPKAVSASGKDRGLMQIRRGAATRYQRMAELPDRELFDPKTNVHLGVWYLADNLERCGSVPRALGAYSSGRCTVNGYARRILSVYKKAAQPAPSPEPLTVITLPAPPTPAPFTVTSSFNPSTTVNQ